MTFEVLRVFKTASKYFVKTHSDGNALLHHGSVVRTSSLYGAELDLMIQFVTSFIQPSLDPTITSFPQEVSVKNCKLIFQEIISGANDVKSDIHQISECFTIIERFNILKKLNK